MSEVVYNQEKFADIYEEMKPLLEKHYHEIAHYQDIKLNPDFEQYCMLEKIGMLKTYTARFEGELIGYSLFFVKKNIHYKDSLQAVQDVIYIDKTRRGFGRVFIDWCDSKLRDYGVQVVYHHVKQEHNFGPMLEKMGYKLIDLIYGRRLDKGT